MKNVRGVGPMDGPLEEGLGGRRKGWGCMQGKRTAKKAKGRKVMHLKKKKSCSSNGRKISCNLNIPTPSPHHFFPSVVHPPPPRRCHVSNQFGSMFGRITSTLYQKALTCIPVRLKAIVSNLYLSCAVHAIQCSLLITPCKVKC